MNENSASEGKKLRWGVLGTARIADSVIGGIRASSNSDLVAVASRDGEKAQRYAAERSIPISFGSYSEMLASNEVDAVYIPLPNALHAQWCVEAASSGKHVLCEKPIAANAGEVERIMQAAQATGVTVMEAFMYRFHPQTLRLRELVQGGAVGTPLILRATFGFNLTRPNDVRWRKELAGGSLLDVGCYCVNIATLLFGEFPSRITASAILTQSGVDASLVGTLQFPGGALATIDSSFVIGKGSLQQLQISGSEGSIRATQPFRMDPAKGSIIEIDPAGGSEASGEARQERVEGVDEYKCMVEHFSAAVMSKREPDYTLAMSLGNMHVLDALAESARTGSTIDLS